MNPFTRFLRQWSDDEPLEQFIAHWDTVEHVMVNLYRGKISLLEAKPLFDEAWPWLRANYGRFQKQLRPYWQQTETAGQITQQDPFQMLIDLPEPAAIEGNWTAMQHLPTAREALNQFLLSK